MTKEQLPPCHIEDKGFFSPYDNRGYQALISGAGHPDGPGQNRVECKRTECGVGVVVDSTDIEFDQLMDAHFCASALAPFCKLLKS